MVTNPIVLEVYTSTHLSGEVKRGWCQVKLRGFRVELSEIEQVLMQRTSFQGTVLVCGETLVAFLVADQVDVKHVKEEVAKVLPYYMVPQVIISSSDGDMSSVCFFCSSIKRSVLRIFESLSLVAFVLWGELWGLNSIPLTQSGKVDRTKLKSLWSKRGAAEHEASGSSTSWELVTEVQREVFEAFKETLGLETLGIHDNFFELGGHSLSAMQLQTALASRGISLTLPEIFRAQTVEKIAKLCDIVSNCSIEAGMHSIIKHQTFFSSVVGCRCIPRLSIASVQWICVAWIVGLVAWHPLPKSACGWRNNFDQAGSQMATQMAHVLGSI